MKALLIFAITNLIFFCGHAQSLSLDEFKKRNKDNSKLPDKNKEARIQNEGILTLVEKAKARDLYNWYTIQTPCTQPDSLRRTSSWIMEKLEINRDQFLKYLNYMGGAPRKEDLPN